MRADLPAGGSGVTGGNAAAEPSGAANAVNNDLAATWQQAVERTFGDALGARLQAGLRDAAWLRPDALAATLAVAYPDKLDPLAGRALLALSQAGATPLPVRVKLVGDEVLGGANGAYSAADGGTVYLNTKLLGAPDALTRTYLEEVGHHLDSANVLGGPDSVGDEGARFAEALLGPPRPDPLAPSATSLSVAERIEALWREDDRGTIMVGDNPVAVEFLYNARDEAGYGSDQRAGGDAAGTPQNDHGDKGNIGGSGSSSSGSGGASDRGNDNQGSASDDRPSGGSRPASGSASAQPEAASDTARVLGEALGQAVRATPTPGGDGDGGASLSASAARPTAASDGGGWSWSAALAEGAARRHQEHLARVGETNYASVGDWLSDLNTGITTGDWSGPHALSATEYEVYAATGRRPGDVTEASALGLASADEAAGPLGDAGLLGLPGPALDSGTFRLSAPLTDRFGLPNPGVFGPAPFGGLPAGALPTATGAAPAEQGWFGALRERVGGWFGGASATRADAAVPFGGEAPLTQAQLDALPTTDLSGIVGPSGAWLRDGLRDPRVQGGLLMVGGGLQMGAGAALAALPEPLTTAAGAGALVLGADAFGTGLSQMLGSAPQDTLTFRTTAALGERLGLSPEAARQVAGLGEFTLGGLGGGWFDEAILGAGAASLGLRGARVTGGVTGNTPVGNVTESFWDHVLNGEVKVRTNWRGEVSIVGSGGHYARSNDVRIVEVTKPADANGVFAAKVQVRAADGKWRDKPEPSTFFPETMSGRQVVQEIESAMANATPVSSSRPNTFRGVSESGIEMQFGKRPDGSTATAYPIHQGK